MKVQLGIALEETTVSGLGAEGVQLLPVMHVLKFQEHFSEVASKFSRSSKATKRDFDIK